MKKKLSSRNINSIQAVPSTRMYWNSCRVEQLTLLLFVHAAVCDEQCSLHGGVCDNGVCEFRCSDYAGYTCQNTSSLLPSLSICADVLASSSPGDAMGDVGQHCAPSEPSILQQLESVVVVPNYNRLMPGGRTLFSILDSGYCAAAAKRLACWVSLIHPSLSLCVKVVLII